MANTENIERNLEAEGEMDYDYVNDILFFKVKNREYNYSLEFNNIVIDIDSEEFVTGIQIFDASQFLKINKENLRKIDKWKFEAKLQSNELRINLSYQVIIRNKVINNNIYPIIMQSHKTNLPSPQTVMAN